MAKLKKKTVKKGKTQKLYVGKEAHDAIIEYQSALNQREKHSVYEQKIKMGKNI